MAGSDRLRVWKAGSHNNDGPEGTTPKGEPGYYLARLIDLGHYPAEF
ncbi:hypothetical protein [Streptomyces violascens]